MDKDKVIETIASINETCREIGRIDMSDITSADERQKIVAEKFRTIATEKILTLLGITWHDIEDDYNKLVRQNK